MNHVALQNSESTLTRPQTSRTHSLETRGRSTSIRSNNQEQGIMQHQQSEQIYQFRPPEVVKNIQKVPNVRDPTFEKSRSRETSTVRKDYLSNVEFIDMRRSSSAASTNFNRPSRVPSNLNPNPQYPSTHHVNNRFRNPISAYSSNEAVDTIVPNHSNILYQKYQRPSITSKPSTESKAPSTISQYQTPRSNVSVSMDQDLVPAFNDLKMELGDAMNDQIDKQTDTFQTDNRYVNSDSNSTKSNNSENPSLLNDANTSPEEPIFKTSISEGISDEKQLPKHVEKFGRIQQRVNFLKQMKDEDSNNSAWKSLSVEQKMFFESLNNDLRNLKRSNHKPFLKSLERTDQSEKQVLNSSASVTSTQYLLKTYNPMTEGKHHSLAKPHPTPTKEIDIGKMKQLLNQSTELAEMMWEAEEEKYRPSQITFKSENKSSTDTAVSSLNSEAFSVKLVSHTYEPKDLDAIKESFDGYEISTTHHNETGDVRRMNDSKQASPLSQRV